MIYPFSPSPGCAHVHHRGDHLRHLLAALSPVLRVRVPQQPDDVVQLRAAAIPGLLLAGHVKRDGQPNHLLLDEQQVSVCW